MCDAYPFCKLTLPYHLGIGDTKNWLTVQGEDVSPLTEAQFDSTGKPAI